MFIRKKTRKDPETQRSYFVYQLVECVRTTRGPRQKILLSMGSQLDIPIDQHKMLADRIEEIVTGFYSLYPCPEKIEQLAQEYAAQLVNQLSDRKKTTTETPEPDKDYHTVDLNTIEQQEPRTVGGEHLLLHAAAQLHLPEKLKEMGLSKSEVALSLGTIIGRALFPASEHATYQWLTKRSGLGELLQHDFQANSLHQLYKISDTLLELKPALEKHLETAQQKIHGYQSTMILYDLTNTYMEGQAKKNPKAQFGHSKEKRFDCRLVTLGLVVNEYGFAKRSEFLPGNVSEPGSLEEAIRTLHDPDDLIKPTLILDAGIATEDNLKWLRKNHYTYVVSARQDPPSLELETALISVGQKNEVKAALIRSDDFEEKWLYCESEAKAATALEMKKAFQKRFEHDLQDMSDGLNKPKARKAYHKIIERVGRLKERHKRVSGCYDIVVHAAPDGKTALSIEWHLLPEKIEARLNGHYFLRTNLIEKGVVQLWELYNSLLTIEDAFRFMKSDLGMRPIYHQKEGRVDGHIWITLLAYHLIQSCLYQLQSNGLCCRWKAICNTMGTRVRVTMKAQTKQDQTVYHRSTTKPEEEHRKIYHALGISPQIFTAKKLIV